MRVAVQRLCVATVVVGCTLTTAACASSNGKGATPVSVKAANDEATKPGAQVLKDAMAAMVSADGVDMSAEMNIGQPPKHLSLVGHFQSDGMTGTEKVSDGGQQLIGLANALYVRTFGNTADALEFGAPIAKLAGKRWVKMDVDSEVDVGTGADGRPSVTVTPEPGDDEGDGPSISGLAKSLTTPDDGGTVNPKVTTGELNGDKVVIVTESDGSSFYVAAEGQPYLLKVIKASDGALSSNGGMGKGTILLSNYGRRITITAPSDAVDLDTLLKQSPGLAFPSGFPSDFPTSLPSGFPTDFPSDFPTDLPSDFPSSLLSEFPTIAPSS